MIKKILFGTMILTATALTKTNAQLRDNLSLGPVLGIGHSWMGYKGNSPYSQALNPVFNGGARLVYSASPHFGFGLDGVFRMEGNRSGTGPDRIIHLNYINLDPKLYYFFGKTGESLRPKIGVGPSFGFLVGGKIKHSVSSAGTTVREYNSKDYYNGFNFGVSGVLGFNYRIKSGTWFNIEAVYNNGISSLFKKAYNDYSNSKSRSLFLNVGVTFGIGHVESKAKQRSNRRK